MTDYELDMEAESLANAINEIGVSIEYSRYIKHKESETSLLGLYHKLIGKTEEYKPVLSATNALIALSENKITLREAIEDCAFVDFSSCLTEYDYMRALYLAKAKENKGHKFGLGDIKDIDPYYIDKDFLIELGAIECLADVNILLRNDKDIIRLAVNTDLDNIVHIPPSILSDSSFMIDLFLNHKPNGHGRLCLAKNILAFLPKELIDNEDFVKASIKLLPRIFKLTNNKIKYDKDYILKHIIDNNLVDYDYLSPEILDDIDIAKAMLDKCVDRHWDLLEVFEHISPRLRNELLCTFIDESQRMCGESHDNFFDHNDSEEFIDKIVEYIPDAFNDVELVMSYITQPVFSSILVMGQSKITRYIRRNGKFIFNNNIYKIIDILKDSFIETLDKEEDIHAYVLSRLNTEEEVEVEEITF